MFYLQFFQYSLFYYGYDIASKLLAFGQKSPALQIPMGLVYMATPVGMGLTLIQLIQNLIKNVRTLQGKEEFEDKLKYKTFGTLSLNNLGGLSYDYCYIIW